jgi:DNA polymerase/3'-5' exonuclease PolX
MSKVKNKISLEDAKTLSTQLVNKLKPYCKRIKVVGSIRRQKKEIGDIDIVIIPLPELFNRVNQIIQVELGGKKKIFGSYKGRPINLFFTNNESWGAALLHSTGPAQFNIRKRFLIKRKGLLLNEYGLFTRNKRKYLVGETEKEIFDYLGWTYKTATQRA